MSAIGGLMGEERPMRRLVVPQHVAQTSPIDRLTAVRADQEMAALLG